MSEEMHGLRRREFLGLLGASFAALAASGCGLRPPKEKIVPALDQAEGVVPGRALWYATVCSACPAGCGALVKCREGRPVKLEGNPEHPLSRGGLCARGQASVLDLYDSERHRGPLRGGQAVSWAQADAAVGAALGKGGRVRLLTHTLAGPSERAAVDGFLKRHPGARHAAYDPLSASAILDAHAQTHGRRVLPSYHLRKAKVVVSFDADFLGTWLSPVEFTKDWTANRAPDVEFELMSWHAQFESRMSLTGANADLRVPLPPSRQYATLCALGRLVAAKRGWTGPLPASGETSVSPAVLADTAFMLLYAGRAGLVLSGSEDLGCQLVVNWINHMLGAYGSTLDVERPSRQREGDDGALETLIAEMAAGRVDVLIVHGANPAYDQARAAAFRAALPRVGLTVSLSWRKDETSALAAWVCPDHHALEAWGDAEPHEGVFSVRQPVLSPLFDTRSALESLSLWSGTAATAHEFVRRTWRAEVFGRQKEQKDFDLFWDETVRKGALVLAARPRPALFKAPAFSSRRAGPAAGPGEFELAAYPSVALGDGSQANNPWLQELPDPIAKTTWGNHASFSPADAARLGLVEGRMVRLSAAGAAAELPAHVQPGLPDGVVAAALGYGRQGAGAVAANFPTRKLLPIDQEPAGGADLYPLLRSSLVKVELLERFVKLAKTQTYDYLVDPLLGERRPMTRETTLEDFARDPRAGNPEGEHEASLWPGHAYPGPKWAMAIDLNACTGCSACSVACTAENNVPVVGRSEVAKSREMQWLRLDRYYSGAPGDGEASPGVSFQPMLCQHCDNAPCETVCPVLATVHSSEGLNMQVYNRCVGTRYCANNCPYKVRRFNWFDYAHEDLLQNLALNPDVTVRTRGVMEKCSFCVQRLYEAKGEARQQGRIVKDGDARPACMQSCPADAILFGDINDPKSRVAKAARSSRGYTVLGELGVGPSVHYLTKVRNKKV